MTDILSIDTIYGIGSVLLTMAVLAPVVFAGHLGRPGPGPSFPGDRLRGAALRLLETTPARPKPTRSEDASFALDLEFAVTRLDRSVIDAKSVNHGNRD